MKIIKSAAIVALMSGCAIATMDVRPASAITLMDFIRGGKKRAPEQVQPSQPVPGFDSMMQQERNAAVNPPRVSGPRYYTYKAEALRKVATDRLVDPVVTGSVRSYGLPPMLRAPLADARRLLPEVDVRATADVAKAVESFYGGRTEFLWSRAAASTLAPNRRSPCFRMPRRSGSTRPIMQLRFPPTISIAVT
jgi:L,D-transpeptidase YcbB